MTPVTVVFGAFDRHNVGDLLFAHVAERLLRPRRLVFAGLADADLRPVGGHRVRALPALLASLRGRPVAFVHAGGELLACGAWEAAAMLLAPQQAQALAARLDADPDGRAAWARERLGLPDLAPYTVAAAAIDGPARVVHVGVGGADLDRRDAALREEVLAKLRCADAIGVRDRQTRAVLARAGIASRLMPDPACLSAMLFHRQIRHHARAGAPAVLRRACRRGYLAVQFSADFGDDATLDALAAALDRAAGGQGCAVVFFRAGAATWHDDLDVYRRTAARMRSPTAILHSLNLWDICAVVAGALAYLGSSLHGRILAMACALPRLNLLAPGDVAAGAKQAAYADTWEDPAMPGVVPAAALPEALQQAMHTDAGRRRELADRLARQCLLQYRALANA